MIGIIGAGAFGTALAVALAKGGRQVRLWARDPAQIAAMQSTRRNEAALPGVALPENVSVHADIMEVCGGQALLLATPMQSLGARAETLAGLSGFGDLVLTCTSAQSRNFRFGLALGRGEAFDPTVTVEGVATARAVRTLAEGMGVDMPVTAMVDALASHQISLEDAIGQLMRRPLKQE
jgi:glycerol-3-phosphate dehydrogenase